MKPSRRATLLGLAAASAAGPALANRYIPVVSTSLGEVAGIHEDGVSRFLGVPYGEPVAGRRFQPPLPVKPWPDRLRAYDYREASPQRGDEPNQAEDCLFLNIWSPGVEAGCRPVMVYIHGGAYSAGSGSAPLYDGRRMVRRGNVVVVTLNHRLNVLGYLSLAELGVKRWADSGNVGQLDLVLALQWIRDHIRTFGGDPERVTLFGQSGGGAKIATLMATPAASGLFHGAITMSGQQVTASEPQNARLRTQAYLDALNLPRDRVEELETMPVERLIGGLAAKDPILPFGSIYFGPVRDGRTLERHPFAPDAPAQSAHIPMIIGNTRDEARAFLAGDERNHHLTWDELPARLAPELRVTIDATMVISEYRRLYPSWSPSEVFFAAATASRSWRAAVIEAEARARQGSATWVYQLDRKSPKDGGKWGAPHTMDIPLAFGNLDAPGSYAGTTPEDRVLSDRVQDAFVAFARSGDPNHAGLPRWEPYGLPRRQTMIFDAPPRVADDPRGAERALFARVPYVQPGT